MTRAPSVLAALVLAVALSASPVPQSSPFAQDSAPKKRKAEAKPAPKTSGPKTKDATGAIGYPSCNQSLLWVDSLCRLDDGRVCLVGEFDITDCK